MALFDQQQQDEEQPNQLQPYGVCVGTRRVRTVQRVPYVPDMNMGRPLFRARQLPAHPVREQQHVMLQDRINQDAQHNIRQDNIAYNRRLYNDPQIELDWIESEWIGLSEFRPVLVRTVLVTFARGPLSPKTRFLGMLPIFLSDVLCWCKNHPY